jgi:ATP-dependent DNA ligase
VCLTGAPRIKLYSRPGNDLTARFPQIVEALARLRSRSCILDGEAVACGEDGIALFERIRYRRHDASVFMWAFDMQNLLVTGVIFVAQRYNTRPKNESEGTR